MSKQKLLVSFSGGETSAFMAQWLWRHKRDQYDMVFVFANTGQENEQTLEFVRKCSDHFGFPVVWIEGVHHSEVGVGTTHKVVDFASASRNGEPFETFISVYSIPNRTTPQCTRELKAYPIRSYARSLGWKGYWTAIGIRADEVDRMSAKRKEERLLYPLLAERPMTKQKVNFWWSQQPFRLELKGYQGNCKWCWKKSNPKLVRIAQEAPEAFAFPASMEDKYGDYFPQHKVQGRIDAGVPVPKGIRFFRGNKSARDILALAAATPSQAVLDDSMDMNIQHDLFDDEACEVFSQCGIDN